MTRRQLNLSLILIFAIATIIAMLFVFNPNIAYAEDTYTITWVNGETTLETDTEVAAGATPTYDGATPTKSSDAEYTYTFAGWSPEVYAADKDQTYTATFTPTIRSYKFTLNAYKQDAIGDGYTLEVIEDTYEAEYGKTITDADIDNIAHFHYVANTNEQFVTITENEATNVVTAYFDRDICSIIYVDDIVMLAELEARYGAPTPTIDDPQDYYDNYQIYEFNGWSPAIKETVEGSQTYTAQITATERKYHAIWLRCPSEEDTVRMPVPETGLFIPETYPGVPGSPVPSHAIPA